MSISIYNNVHFSYNLITGRFISLRKHLFQLFFRRKNAEICIPPVNRRVSYSRAAKDVCLFLRESEANAGHFSPNKHEKTADQLQEKKTFETLKGFGGIKT